jgi:hypothetical protein
MLETSIVDPPALLEDSTGPSKGFIFLMVN